MNKTNILKELNVQLQIVRVNKNIFTGNRKLRIKANKRIDLLTTELAEAK